MSKSASLTSKNVGTIVHDRTETPRTVVADVVIQHLDLTDWAVFRKVAECSEATIPEVRE
ncbi:MULTISPECIES: hypothetical protein [Haloarcula]|uniref:Uncharacterized protein n=2 Tax=Haloarcula sebkhae TaxID=932660 RepID=A0A830EPU6_9EURY|nr:MULTISPECIES: hypothetical protein [Haloarcula]GGK78749.1 hypothetical protein GCM10009067_33840 [Haloarcula sebkhae]